MDIESLDNLMHDFPIDIDTLAALVEGDLGCQEADAVRELLLSHDPELATQIEMMARDRVMLRTLGDEQPPAWLAESVIARLEREALLGLAGGDPLTDSLPISSVRVVRPSRVVGGLRWMTSHAGVGLALAAVVVLSIGIGLQLLPGGSGAGSVPVPVPGPIAQNDSSVEGQDIAIADDRVLERVAGEEPQMPDDMREEQAHADREPATTTDPAMLFTNDWGRALALLAEGRLLVRVRSVDPETTIAQLDRFADRAVRPGASWRLGTDVSEPIVVAMESRFAPVVTTPEPIEYASGDMPESGSAPQPLRSAVSLRPSPLEAIYMADTRLDRAAMASLRSALSLGDGQVAVFEELAEPMELPRVLTPDAVLWWGRPAREWTERVFVPIVVERVEK